MSRRFPLAPFALAADNHPRETLEPPSFGNFWLGKKPVRELTELISRNFSVSDSIEQMI